MLAKRKQIIVLFSGILIALLAYHLRLQKFYFFPPVNDTGDEYKYAFNGISLIKKGVPESWSWFEDYKNYQLFDFRGTRFRMVKPYFEDPPLFGLIMGSYAISKGMDGYEKVDAGALRWPMIKLGALNVFLLFFLVYFLAGFWEAVCSGLLYATIPSIVLSSRLPLAENFLITLTLSSLILFFLNSKANSKILSLLLYLISGSAILVKQTGIFLPVAIIFLFLASKKNKMALQLGIFTLFFFLIWIGYGYYYDWSLFLHMIGVFSGREIRLPSMIINLFDTFRISEKMMSTDGIIIWGWISVIINSFLEKRKQKFYNLVFPTLVISYLVFFSIMSGHAKGWYRFPFHPFLSWAIAAVFIDLVNKPKLIISFFFMAIAFFSSLISGTGESFWGPLTVKFYQILFPLSMLPFLIFELKEKIWAKKNVPTHISNYFFRNYLFEY